MEDNKRKEVIENMLKIRESLQEELKANHQEIENIGYYRDFPIKGTKLGIDEAYIVKIKDDSIPEKETKPREKDEKEEYLYRIYDQDNNLVATVDREGNLEFNQEYLENVVGQEYVEFLELEDAEFELPEELERDDLVLTREELEESKSKIGKKDSINQLKEQKEPEKENSQEKAFAEKKGIPQNNVLKLRENSNFYKDHPEVEENLYFYKGNDGIVRAEYIDENGEPQPSKFFEESSTALRQETVSMGDDGNPVVKETPYQVMQTKNLARVDKDIRDIRININIDSYGYLDIEEARQGSNGMWSSHDIEVQGRDYNSYGLNKMTSIETRRADPDKLTEAYKSVEGTEVAEDGIEFSEMYLMHHAKEFVQRFIDEGYNKDEAIEIFDLMVGEEKLPEDQAKEEVNKNIKEQNKEKEEKKIEEEEIEDEGRTPWGDAEARSRR